MNDLPDYINTAIQAAALGGATFAANWVRKVVGRYFKYLDAKVVRWSTKDASPQALITPEMQRAIETAASRMLVQLIKQRKERARAQTR